MSADQVSQWPLILMWLAYFALHSLLASAPAKAIAAARWPVAALGYRLAFNAIAVILLVPIGVWLTMKPGAVMWAWTGGAAWIANGLAVLALIAMQRTSQYYDMNTFLGLRRQSPTAVGRFTVSPWHRYVRHPWYTFGLVIIWTRDMNSAWLVSAILMTIYLVIGSRLEEEKLIAEFGDVYRQYRQRVPGLLPWPGKVLTADQARHLIKGP